jgi:hypothetical protein
MKNNDNFTDGSAVAEPVFRASFYLRICMQFIAPSLPVWQEPSWGVYGIGHLYAGLGPIPIINKIHERL